MGILSTFEQEKGTKVNRWSANRSNPKLSNTIFDFQTIYCFN